MLTRISSGPGEDETGVWSPDGRWIAWAGSRPGERRAIFRRRADGSGPEERLWSDPRHFHGASWTREGIVVTVADAETGWDVLLLDPDEPSGVRPVLAEAFDEMSARVSPDGRLIAYVSNETGRQEVYVQGFPESRGPVRVSVDGGREPVWRPGSRELMFRGSDRVMRVALGPGDRPDVTAPANLVDDAFRRDWGDHTEYAVDARGHILGMVYPDREPLRDIRIVFDWMESAGLKP